MMRFGIREQFMLLDRHRLAPAARSDEVLDAILLDPQLVERVGSGFLTAQLEHATSTHDDLGSARAESARFRSLLAEVAADLDLVPVSAGTPFDGGDPVTASERARSRAEDFGELLADHRVNGLQVRVEVPDPGTGVRALNGMRPWLPALLAITGDSPFWGGRDTGFASWRSILLRRHTTAGCPPAFAGIDDYRARTRALVDLGAVPDPSAIAWAARLDDEASAVEIAVFDAQPTIDDTLLATALARALVVTEAGRPAPAERPLPDELLDAALWQAARAGTAARLPDPGSGSLRPVWEIVERLVDTVRPALDDAGDTDLVLAGLDRVRRSGTGAQRQRAVHGDRGVFALREWYERTLAAAPAVGPVRTPGGAGGPVPAPRATPMPAARPTVTAPAERPVTEPTASDPSAPEPDDRAPELLTGSPIG